MPARGEIRSLYRDGRLVPFIGAGLSMAVTWTVGGGGLRRGLSWGEMVDQATRMLGFEDPALVRVRGTDLQILEYFSLCRGGMTALTNWMFKETSAPDDALRASPVHKELAALDRCHLYYTTNYDDYLERSLQLCGRPAAVVAGERDMGMARDGCEVVKFHGDFNNPAAMVCSESDYEHRLSLSTPMDRRLVSDLLGRALLFLGYSFRDPNVAYLFRRVTEQLGALPNTSSGRRAYIVVEEPSDFERRLFSARNIEVVPVSERTREADIADLLREIRT